MRYTQKRIFPARYDSEMKIRCLLLCLLLPPAAFAQPQRDFDAVRWDYVSASLAIPDLDALGIEIEGATKVTRDLVVFGGYRDFEPDKRFGRKTLQIGVGHVWNVRPNIDIMASASYGDNEIERPGPDLDEEGLILGGYVRGLVTARFELNGALLLDNSTGSNTDTVVEFGGQYFYRSNWSYGGRVRIDENDTAVFVGARFYFGASRR